MAGRDALGPHGEGVVEESLELDLGVAEHIGVGRAPRAVLGEEGCEDALAVLGGEIDGFEIDADALGGRGGIDQVLARRAMLRIVVVFPVLHEEADHVVAGAPEKERRHRRIHASGEAHHDPHVVIAKSKKAGCEPRLPVLR